MYTLILILLIIIMLFFSVMTKKFWLNPANIMILYWSFFSVLAMFAFRGKYQWYYVGLYWIIFSCLFFAIGYFIGKVLFKHKYSSQIHSLPDVNNKQIKSNVSWIFIVFCIVLGLLRAFIELKENGYSFQIFFNLNSLIELNTTIAYQRYYENGNGNGNNIIMQMLLVFTYAAPLCGGYAFNFSKNMLEKMISIFTFLPIVISLFINNAKAGVIASLFLWFSGFIISFSEKYKRSPKINVIKLIKLTLLSSIFIGMLYFSMLLRIGDFSENTRETVNNKFITYAFGHMQSFDYWFEHFALNIDHTLGLYTFLGFFDLLGFAKREQGVFDSLYINGYLSSNVYTAFRGIITDFGVIGGLFFIMIIGIISGYSFYSVLYKNRNIMAKIVLSAIYFFIFYSFIISPWTYLSYSFSFFLFVFYLWLSKLNFKTSYGYKLMRNEYVNQI